jgi:hypothetical protein
MLWLATPADTIIAARQAWVSPETSRPSFRLQLRQARHCRHDSLLVHHRTGSRGRAAAAGSIWPATPTPTAPRKTGPARTGPGGIGLAARSTRRGASSAALRWWRRAPCSAVRSAATIIPMPSRRARTRRQRHPQLTGRARGCRSLLAKTLTWAILAILSDTEFWP